MKRVLVPLAPGFEEVEALTVVDYLRRAGAHVVTASVGAKNPIAGKQRIRVMADIDLQEALDEWGDAFDLVVLPGGPGVAKLAESEPLMQLLRVGFAFECAHGLAYEEAEDLVLAGQELGDLAGVGVEDGVDRGDERAAVGDLAAARARLTP